jgi:hypothetical protein
VNFLTNSLTTKSRYSSVGIALGYGLEDWDSTVRFPGGAGIFLFTTASRTALGPTQPPIQGVPGVLSLWVKRPRREVDHSPPSSAMAWCLVKAQGQLYLYLLPLLTDYWLPKKDYIPWSWLHFRTSHRLKLQECRFQATCFTIRTRLAFSIYQREQTHGVSEWREGGNH